MFKQAIDWPRPLKKIFVIVVDMVLALFATWVAYSLRFETLHWPHGQEWGNYLLSPLFAVLIFWAFGLYRAVFRYFGSATMLQTARAVLCYAVALIGYHLWQIWPTFPLTLGILQPIIFMLLLAASRVFAQFWLVGMSLAKQDNQGRLLIYGAGEAGAQIATALAVTGQFKLLGFLDDDTTKAGQTINGVPVFAASAAPDGVRKLAATDIVLALPSSTRERRNQIIARLGALQVHTPHTAHPSCTHGAKPRRLRSIYKHVPMVECNPSEGIFNNVFGTLNMAQAAQAAGVARYFMTIPEAAQLVLQAAAMATGFMISRLRIDFGVANTHQINIILQ